jgi:hypothetical protein
MENSPEDAAASPQATAAATEDAAEEPNSGKLITLSEEEYATWLLFSEGIVSTISE